MSETNDKDPKQGGEPLGRKQSGTKENDCEKDPAEEDVPTVLFPAASADSVADGLIDPEAFERLVARGNRCSILSQSAALP